MLSDDPMGAWRFALASPDGVDLAAFDWSWRLPGGEWQRLVASDGGRRDLLPPMAPETDLLLRIQSSGTVPGPLRYELSLEVPNAPADTDWPRDDHPATNPTVIHPNDSVPGYATREFADHFELMPAAGSLVSLELSNDYPALAGLEIEVTTDAGAEVRGDRWSSAARQQLAFEADGRSYHVVVRVAVDSIQSTAYKLRWLSSPPCPADSLEGVDPVDLDTVTVASATACARDTDTFVLTVPPDAGGAIFVVEPLVPAPGLVADVVAFDSALAVVDRGTVSEGGAITVHVQSGDAPGARMMLRVFNRSGSPIQCSVRAVEPLRAAGCLAQWDDPALEGYGFADVAYRRESSPRGSVLPPTPFYTGRIGFCAGRLDERALHAFYRDRAGMVRVGVLPSEADAVEWWVEGADNESLTPGRVQGGFVTFSIPAPGWYAINVRAAAPTWYSVAMDPPTTASPGPEACNNVDDASSGGPNDQVAHAVLLPGAGIRADGRVCPFDVDLYVAPAGQNDTDIVYTLEPMADAVLRVPIALDAFNIAADGADNTPLDLASTREYRDGVIHVGWNASAGRKLLRVRSASVSEFGYRLVSRSFDCTESFTADATLLHNNDVRSRAEFLGVVDRMGAGVSKTEILCASPGDAGDWFSVLVGGAGTSPRMVVTVTNDTTELMGAPALRGEVVVVSAQGQSRSFETTPGANTVHTATVEVMEGDTLYVRVHRADLQPAYNFASPYTLRLTPAP